MADVKYRQMTHTSLLTKKCKKGTQSKVVFFITISIELDFRCFFPLTCVRAHKNKGDLCIYYSVISLQELFRYYYTSSPQKQNSSSLLSCSTSERTRIARKVKKQEFVTSVWIRSVLLKNVKDISNSRETERRFFHPRSELLSSHYTLPLIDISPHDSPAPER